VVMWNKEYLAALRPLDGALVLETMHFNDEVVKMDTVPGVEVKARVDDRELKMATQLIDSLSTDFKPAKYKDEYREQVMEIIERKAAGEEIHTAPTREEKGGGRATNLMAALEASLAKSRGGGGGDTNGHGRARATATATRTTRRRKSA
jgi:DNA end-binding protein Ku